MSPPPPTIFEIIDNGASIRYGVPGQLLWQIRIDAIQVFAEYTTPNGPYADDYFLLFEWSSQGEATVSQASFYSDNVDGVIAHLARVWNTEIGLGLAASTDWKSRIVWPPALEGGEYFVFTKRNWRTIEHRRNPAIAAYLDQQGL